MLVPRTCTMFERQTDESGNVEFKETGSDIPISELRSCDAYVLLGPPGSGKTTLFKSEADKHPGATYENARDFLVLPGSSFKDSVVYIDGLDEIRTNLPDERTALDEIRRKLAELSIKQFRLSCRELHWLGENDHEHLEKLSPNGKLVIARLDPLTEQDIGRIVEHLKPKVEFSQFIKDVRERGIEFLAQNPQTLQMLLDVFDDGALPVSRTELYSLSCEMLVREDNPEHELANSIVHSEFQLLNSAGRLCITHLLTATSGFALHRSAENSEFILPEGHGVDRSLLRNTLRTRLFQLESQGHIQPIHRSIAEYLAAATLTELIDTGQSVRRLLSIIGNDALGIAKNLHGLVGWLATLSKRIRSHLIDLEPIGVLVEADLSDFNVEQVKRLFHAVVAKTRLHLEYWETIRTPETIRKFARTDLRDFIQERLQSKPDADDLRQTRLYVTLLILNTTTDALRFFPSLIEITRSSEWPLQVRSLALSIAVKCSRTSPSYVEHLKVLLTDIHEDRVQDPQHELTGKLLESLYPKLLNDVYIWSYLDERVHFFGRDRHFWIDKLARHYGRSRGAKLLDGFLESRSRVSPDRQSNPELARFQHRILLITLQKTLSSRGQDLELDRTLDWLEMIARTKVDGFAHEVSIPLEELQRWFEEHSEFHKQLIARQIHRIANQVTAGDSTNNLDRNLDVLYDMYLIVANSPDYSYWHLDRARQTNDQLAAQLFLRLAAVRLGPHLASMDDIQLDSLKAKLDDRSDLFSIFTKHVGESAEAHNRLTTLSKSSTYKETNSQWVNIIKEHMPSLKKLDCNRSLLNELAKAYYGAFDDILAEDPYERLLELLDGDKPLVQLVLANFRNAIYRSDAPSLERVLDLIKAQQADLLTFPITAGLHEMCTEIENAETILTADQIRLALALYLLVPHDPLNHLQLHSPPGWVQALFVLHPILVAETIMTLTTNAWRDNVQLSVDLRWLLSSSDLGNASHTLCFELLDKFPIRATSDQSRLLTTLLEMGSRTDPKRLSNLVSTKLNRSSMLMACRIRWIVAGVFTAIPKSRELVKSETSGKERRVREISTAILEWVDDSAHASVNPIREQLRAADYHVLISSIAPYYDLIQPDEIPLKKPQIVTHDMNIAHRRYGLIPQLIDRLATDESEVATRSLQNLRQNESLHTWHDEFDEAINRQLFVRLQNGKVAITENDVQSLLDNGPPVSPEDLMRIAVDQIVELGTDIRKCNTSDWRQYWTDINGEPKPENQCRDAFLSDLKRKLDRFSVSINAQPEPEYGDDKRADIGICYKDTRIPVEVKKDTSPDLWTAIEGQLLNRYMTDPSTYGIGIYLVFWFGYEPIEVPNSHKRIESPQELKEYLKYTLDQSARRRINICVIDVSNRSVAQRNQTW